jgi:hypothetical protein
MRWKAIGDRKTGWMRAGGWRPAEQAILGSGKPYRLSSLQRQCWFDETMRHAGGAISRSIKSSDVRVMASDRR